MFSIYTHRQAFSLVELSIVLVILGLLVGGILAGKALIDASELRKISADFTRYEGSINAFRDKYFFYPGDLPNATQFWGAAGGSSSDNYTVTCYPTVNTDNTTCNGDGDGKHLLGTRGAHGEDLRAWQHLSNAGMIEGSYSGTIVDSSTYPYGFIEGQNLPPGPRQSVYTIGRIIHMNNTGPVAFVNPRFYNIDATKRTLIDDYITISVGARGAVTGPASYTALFPFLTAGDAWNIDNKMDDGIADSGKMRGAMVHTGPASQVRYQLTDGSVGGSSAIWCAFYSLDNIAGKNCTLSWRVTQ